jgi:hypothetical protein
MYKRASVSSRPLFCVQGWIFDRLLTNLKRIFQTFTTQTHRPPAQSRRQIENTRPGRGWSDCYRDRPREGSRGVANWTPGWGTLGSEAVATAEGERCARHVWNLVGIAPE